MATNANALTVVDRVEQSSALMMLDARGQALVDLLPDAAAATRFRRVVIQALIKNPELLECTPESVVLSVFEAAAQGLEPTGAAGGAHLVPYNVKVQKNPDRYEKRAQLIPDYRGVIRLVTKPPSEVLSLEARVVKEGDEFRYQLGTEAFVEHVPSLLPGRSERATTHVYAIARLKNGASIPDVEDRAGIERVRARGGRGGGFSPWATDWDEMGKKTIIKRISKVLPVRPEIRSILVREDELSGGDPDVAGGEPSTPRGPTKASRLATRLVGSSGPAADETTATPSEPEVAEGQVREDPTWMQGAPVAEPTEAEQVATETPAATAVDVDLATLLRDTAAASGMKGPMTEPQRARLVELLGGLNGTGVVPIALTAIWGEEAAKTLTAAQVQSLLNAAESVGAEVFVEQFRAVAERAKAAA
jgi:recombination protein RecT